MGRVNLSPPFGIKMSLSRSSLHWFFIAILVLSLGGVYLSSLAPGLTWAHNGADGGDFISAAATGGVPHPSGYPTYLLLARAFQFIPIGSLAFRTNLLSAVCALAAAIFVYLTVARLPFFPGPLKWLGGLIAALAYGLSPLAWSQAVITEVYSLQAFFLAVLLYLWSFRLEETKRIPIRYDVVTGLVGGLALGNHMTTLFLLPLAFLMGGVLDRSYGNGLEVQGRRRLWSGWKIGWKSIGLRLAGFLVGLSVYIALPLRAGSNPPINWGDPVTLKGFLWLVSGQLYAGRLFGVPLDLVVSRIQYWANLLIDQFGWVGLVVGLYGLSTLQGASVKKLYYVTGWLFFAFSIFSIGYNSYDSDVYLIPAFMAYALWVGLGAAALIQWLQRRKAWLGFLAGALVLAALVVPAIIHYPAIDVSHDRTAEAYGTELLDSTPADAIIFTEGDKATFTLWYFHFVLQQRPDIAVVVTGLLPYDWYRDTLMYTYPALSVPGIANGPWGATLIQANPDRVACIATYQDAAEFSCR